MGWLAKQIAKLLLNLAEGMLDFFGDFINNIFYDIAAVNDNEIVSAVVLFTTTLALVLIVVLAAKQIYCTYILQTSGDPDSDPLNYLVRVSISIAFISCNGWIFTELMNLSKALTTDVTGAADLGLTAQGEAVLSAMDEVGNSLLIFAIIFVVIMVAIIMFSIVAGIRGAELVLMKILFPIFALDYVTDTRERWNGFIVSYLVCFLGYTLQMLFFSMFSTIFGYIQAGQLDVALIATCGWAVLMIRSPKWLERYVYTSGVARSGGGAIKGAARAVLWRKLK